jgi:putative aldouronate transport system substrate-binding protein
MKRIALLMVLMLVLSSVDSCSDATAAPEAPAAESGEIAIPDSIHVVMDNTVFNPNNGQAEFEAQLEAALPGNIDIQFDSQDHSGYIDAVGRIFASNDWPDVLILPPAQNVSYALLGALYDVTELYENASFQDRLLSDVNNNNRINGRIYGVSMTRGNGTHTFVKKAWMDAVGITTPPATWDEYYDMLLKFVNDDPDGDGAKDTYAVAAAGFIGPEAPWMNYLPEFYQDTFPEFYPNASGEWVDGFDTPEMEATLARLRQAFEDGVIDPETLTMGPADVRNKFYEDIVGVFTYWAGTWNRTLMNNLEANGLDTELVTLPPIAEVGSYYERHAPVWAITTQAENPEGVFKYFLEPMLDGGPVQLLWTYGAKGTHWDDVAETITWGENEATFEAGTFHMRPSLENPDTLLTRNHLDPMLTIAPLLPEYAKASVDTVIDENNAFFVANSKLAPALPTSEILNDYSGDIGAARREVIQQVIVQGGDITEWMQYYRDTVGSQTAEVLADLNG